MKEPPASLSGGELAQNGTSLEGGGTELSIGFGAPLGTAPQGARTSSTASHASSNSAASITLLSGLCSRSQETPLAEETESRTECGVSAPAAGEDGWVSARGLRAAADGVPEAEGACEGIGEGTGEGEFEPGNEPALEPTRETDRDAPREVPAEGESAHDSALGSPREAGCESAPEPAAEPLREALRGVLLEKLLSGVPDLLWEPRLGALGVGLLDALRPWLLDALRAGLTDALWAGLPGALWRGLLETLLEILREALRASLLAGLLHALRSGLLEALREVPRDITPEGTRRSAMVPGSATRGSIGEQTCKVALEVASAATRAARSGVGVPAREAPSEVGHTPDGDLDSKPSWEPDRDAA